MTLDFLAHPFWHGLSAVLVHFVWQAAAVGCVIGVVLAVWRPRRPQQRYAAFLVAFLALPCCAVVTFLTADAHKPASGDSLGRSSPAGSRAVTAYSVPGTQYSPKTRYGNDAQFHVSAGATPTPAHPIGEWRRSPVFRLERVRPWLILGWLAGVALFSLRMLLGAAAIAWIRRRAIAAPAEWHVQARRLSRRLGVAPPRLVVSRQVRQALAAGLFRPIIVLPAAWATGLQPGIAEAVLAHELAHLRRHDVWLNLVQRIVEALFFYHPVMWWLSARVRQERELCCDDLAVAATGDRLGYAAALELAARGQRPARELLLANGIGGRKMAVLERVRHVLNLEPVRNRRWSPGGLVALAVPALLWSAAAVWEPARADDVELVFVQDEAEREGGERGESPEARLDRERREQDGDRRAEERERDRGDREEGEAGDRGEREEDRIRYRRVIRDPGPRDGEARDPRGPRDADDDPPRPRGPRDGERPRIGPPDPGVEREVDRPDDPRVVRRREWFERRGDLPPGQQELLEAIRELRREVEELRREVRELRDGRPVRSLPPGGPMGPGGRPGAGGPAGGHIGRPGGVFRGGPAGGDVGRPQLRDPAIELRFERNRRPDPRDGEDEERERPEREGDRPDAPQPERERLDRDRAPEERVEDPERDSAADADQAAESIPATLPALLELYWKAARDG